LYFGKYVDYIKSVFESLKKYYDDKNETDKLKNIETLIQTLDKINTKAAGNGKRLGELLKDIMKFTFAVGGNVIETELSDSTGSRPSPEEAIMSTKEVDFDTIHARAEKKTQSLNKYQMKFQKLFPQVVDQIRELIPSEWK
jgi:hypothetical protein